ncbi:GTP-binding protein [Stenoxybacter acetivorans]|uniref:GTP-binding protein n=1 Tax=Stenoxybacter acetivorans TaxID=422441 RepID=UPI000562C139|nr:ATP/GTP-binding protein [Stenoxybacter acetivorans]
MIENKIIFTGPVGVGKTTAIAALSDDPPVQTDASASDMTQVRKGYTTVAMDYGVIRLDENHKVHLYGTPGQERFDFMWGILSKGSMGLILLLDNTRANPFKDLQFFLTSFSDLIHDAPIVIGITKMDLSSQPGIESYQQYLAQHGLNVPVFEVDARSEDDVKQLVTAMLYSIDPGLRG